MKENRLENRLELAQDLLDSGLSYGKVAEMIGESKQVVHYWMKTGKIEKYDAFDEVDDRKHLYQNFEWLWEEDKLEELTLEAYESEVVIDRKDEDWLSIFKYLTNKYMNIENYLSEKSMIPLLDYFLIKCSKCEENIPLRNYSKVKTNLLGINDRCNKCQRVSAIKYYKNNKAKFKVNNLNRLAKKRYLPDDFTTIQLDEKLEFFRGCALTGLTADLHLDHVVPIASGHGGTTTANMLPLLGTLNISKNDDNIFEWFASVRQRFELSQERFDKLIDYLASANALTVEEYREFVYWCHDNPRTIDEIKRDQRHSIKIWREAVGKQFPLPSYAMSYENNIEEVSA